MRHLEEMKSTVSELADMLADEQLRQSMSAMLLPVSVFLKEMVDVAIIGIPKEVESGEFDKESLVETSEFYEDIQKLYATLIFNEVNKGVVDINTGYLMDIENSLSTMCQIFKLQLDRDATAFYPSQTNILAAKESINKALTSAASDSKNGNISFFEVH